MLWEKTETKKETVYRVHANFNKRVIIYNVLAIICSLIVWLLLMVVGIKTYQALQLAFTIFLGFSLFYIISYYYPFLINAPGIIFKRKTFQIKRKPILEYRIEK